MEQWLATIAYETPQQRAHLIEQKGYAQDYFLGENTDDFFSLIEKSATGTMYNVHRGTSNTSDIETDSQLAFGNLTQTSRYKRSKAHSERMMVMFGQGRNVKEVGHSLGGSLAEEISVSMGTESVAYNMGTTPFKDYSSTDRTRHKHIRNQGDVISAFDNSNGVEHRQEKPVYHGWLDFPLFAMNPLLGVVTHQAKHWYNSHKLSSI